MRWLRWPSWAARVADLPAMSGLAIARPGQTAEFFGDIGRGEVFRVASISKIVTAGVCLSSGIDPHDDMSDHLGWPLRHPDHPTKAITAGMVAAHHAGLSDRAGLHPDPHRDLQRMCASPAPWTWEPGQCLSYCNFGYVLLAAAAEGATGRRFGDLAQDWLAQRRIGGGFNFWGLDPDARAMARPCLRPDPGGRFSPQIDESVAGTGFVDPLGSGNSAPDPGSAPWLWSPQGGLRTDLKAALRLAQEIPNLDPAPIWRRGQGKIDGPASVYQSWGFGLQILDEPRVWPRRLIGHFGDAYGFRGGVWHDPKTGVSFAYFLNGIAEARGPEADDFSPSERALFQEAERKLRL